MIWPPEDPDDYLNSNAMIDMAESAANMLRQLSLSLADDAAFDAMTRVLTRALREGPAIFFARFSSEQALRSYIHRSARNALSEAFRRDTRRHIHETYSMTRRTRVEHSTLIDPVQVALIQNAISDDRGTLTNLTDNEREVLRLFVRGMTLSQIADLLGKRRQTIHATFKSALEKLARLIDNEP